MTIPAAVQTIAQTITTAPRLRVPPLALLERYLAEPLFPSTPNDERYTRPPTIRWCLERAGLERYDLDVAACRESHHARDWYGLDHKSPTRRNGLAIEWPGNSFGNIPFSQWGHWIAWAWIQFLYGERFASHSMILPNDRTEQAPWQDMIEPYRDVGSPWLRLHFMPQRTKYSGPGMGGRVISNSTKKGGSPFFSSALLVWNRTPRRVVDLPGRESRHTGPIPRNPSQLAVLPLRGVSLARRYT